MRWSLLLSTLSLRLVLAQSEVASSIARWNLSSRMQGFKKCDQRGSLGRSQILSVRWHVAASLDYLTNQLILGKSHGNTVKSRTSLPALVAKRMAVAALLGLEDERALPLESSPAV